MEFEKSKSGVVSVQELAKNPIIKIPKNFIDEKHDQETESVSNGKSFPEVPIIDFKLLIKEESLSHLEYFHSSCIQWGFFQLVNHGVDLSLMEKLKKEIEGFFKLPLEEKMKYGLKAGGVEGYGAMVRSDQTIDWGDRFYIITNPIHRRNPSLFPQLHPSLRDTLECYIQELQKLSKTLFKLMAKALKMEMKEMEKFEDGMQSIRMTYYPPCPQPNMVMGLKTHSDASGLTILHQLNGVDGLQVLKDGVWIPINFLPNAFVVNLGDISEILSNGVYNSIEHRATVNSEKERISIAAFFNPKFDAEIGPAISLINPKNPPLFKTIGMEDYVKGYFSRNKLDGKTYLDLMRIKNDDDNHNIG